MAALGALLSAWRIHGNVGMAECAAKRILELQPANASAYVLLSTIYAAAGKRRLYENVQQQIQEQCLKKQSGRTWIEMNKVFSSIALVSKSNFSVLFPSSNYLSWCICLFLLFKVLMTSKN